MKPSTLYTKAIETRFALLTERQKFVYLIGDAIMLSASVKDAVLHRTRGSAETCRDIIVARRGKDLGEIEIIPVQVTMAYLKPPKGVWSEH